MPLTPKPIDTVEDAVWVLENDPEHPFTRAFFADFNLTWDENRWVRHTHMSSAEVDKSLKVVRRIKEQQGLISNLNREDYVEFSIPKKLHAMIHIALENQGIIAGESVDYDEHYDEMVRYIRREFPEFITEPKKSSMIIVPEHLAGASLSE